MTSAIELEKVRITFGTFTAVHETDLQIRDGEFFSFLGPSGCGKTTLLRTISGFVQPSSGHVRIGGADMAGIGPNKRPTALIFQNLALFPMMSVAENVAYGLRVRGVGKSEREARALKLLDQVALSPHAHKKVSALSGGQKQRVAIARALAVEPKVLLLDEPLSALDLKLRQHMRRELREIQQRVGITFIYITHDQGEALNMSDRIAVMNAGRIEQVGHGREIYANPQSAFVASFVGESNVIPGRVAAVGNGLAHVETPLGRLAGRVGLGPDGSAPIALSAGDEAQLFVRPEQIRLVAPDQPRPACGFGARLRDLSFEGSMTHLELDAGLGMPCNASFMTSNAGALPEIGTDLALQFDPLDAIVLRQEGRAA
ncbi:ABC transporter ATP-binding protein [Pseudooceanicola sp. CBS1P-1]|uniref:ATP-binding cassette domain-containing protein n=1 Tax=Pseudooceanicola albus TaxID=2692189 RepID=A0A6L7G4H5_9RHOB|nr:MULTISPECIES: ABC transporter ATP-binding protein [Pseudooceanicola]MBT9385382.1 ABC transporter ATP-binding protein [Pseudooceanicola endophyticus]MXN18759.1 ATP-binding cassette domain-containing protein [Pseudooceanicola albus]